LYDLSTTIEKLNGIRMYKFTLTLA
jgi:hypothetical protein